MADSSSYDEILELIVIFLDALFLYVPLINEDTKCVMLDNRLMIAAIILRSVGDLIYVRRIYLRIKHEWHHCKDGWREWMGIAKKTICILPVPQVVILTFLPKMRGLKSLKIMKFLSALILLQYLPRLYPFFKMCKRVNNYMIDFFKTKNKERLMELPKWFGIAINIVGYILASHVLGAFCSFASNLNSSTYGWENLFVVVISISGLVLFMYLLGHSQTYMQETDRREKIKCNLFLGKLEKVDSLKDKAPEVRQEICRRARRADVSKRDQDYESC
ncbi:hypothetical protein M0R45_036620 [Rubus argutus]|uniref:Uncharacterized protein n=1 Tax=Rubus argutus TaxID=59490 RepID=A0AAW1VWQ6_RUBAR